MDQLPFGAVAALVGLGTGMILGLAARLGSFCTLGAIESAFYGEDQRRARMWGVVLGTAITAIYLLEAGGQIDLQRTIYHQFDWNPLASIIGGLIFGYGMALAGNCGFGALARFGGGEIRAMVVVVVMGIFGFITLNGPLAELRVLLFPITPAEGAQGLPQLFTQASGLPMLVAALPVAGLLFFWAFVHAPLRHSPSHVFWGIAAGLALAGAFWGTSVLERESMGEVAVSGHTFTAPLGRTLLYLMTSSAGGLSFSVGSVLGVLSGALLGSFIKREFRWEACEDPRELGRLVSGAALMGVGGIVAMGCSIGQGASGFSTLAFSGPVTLAAIIVGALVGLRQLLQGFQPG
ncbi:YeeE/YedE family protein [Brevirhabdus pacifica]|uniref:YeeE/YedE family protein n=1 Tax=Brevirhabdus pacifica TaxID=1267768 RepID=A0A1U7DHS9_9RHOB|nr:YeeE/YedE family protein [Brevirhabdus pacifica]APX89428.1 YeeE/YedE family protein [Brevirhabdus pacifica]OWU76552.1 YeeE/YedE family protein [Loktanella sp. 22II-4b]PJJ85929.1 hypothetical protein CLV77_0461 [Brevirhabdus pacifica]